LGFWCISFSPSPTVALNSRFKNLLRGLPSRHDVPIDQRSAVAEQNAG